VDDETPKKSTFHYKSFPVGADSAVVGGWLFYYDAGLDSVLTIEEVFVTLPPASTWTYFEWQFNLTDTLVADTLNIAFLQAILKKLEVGLVLDRFFMLMKCRFIVLILLANLLVRRL